MELQFLGFFSLGLSLLLGHDFALTILVLGQDCSKSNITGICFHNNWFVSVQRIKCSFWDILSSIASWMRHSISSLLPARANSCSLIGVVVQQCLQSLWQIFDNSCRIQKMIQVLWQSLVVSTLIQLGSCQGLLYHQMRSSDQRKWLWTEGIYTSLVWALGYVLGGLWRLGQVSQCAHRRY